MSSAYYQTAHWRALRQQCLERDHYRCTVEHCGRPGRVADHIETRPNVPEPTSYDVLINLRTLCKSCSGQAEDQATTGGKRRVGR